MTVKPRKSAILPAEPLVVDVRLENRGEQTITIELGYDGIGAFWFEIINSMGQTISTSDQIRKSGIGTRGLRTLRPGEASEEQLIMNMWCSTLLPAGQYTVVMNWYTSYWETRPLPVETLQVRETFALNVMPGDDRKLASLLNKLKVDALDRTTGVADRRLSAQMLLNSQSPVAVNSIREFLAKIHQFKWEEVDVGTQAIEALGRIQTVESVQALTEVAFSTDANDEADWATHAVRMVYWIYDNAVDRPEVMKACQSVMQVHPRPAPLPIRVD